MVPLTLVCGDIFTSRPCASRVAGWS